MDRIEIIKIFRRVAEAKSFSRVAKELNTSQPTISKAIAGLEGSLGVSVFRRNTRGLSLTSEGQKLYHASASLLEHFEKVMAESANHKFNLTGEMRITASLAFARLVFCPLFDRFTGQHPNLRFSFILSDGYVDLIENNIDLAIRIGELPDSQLRSVKIGISRRAIYASPKYLAKFGEPKKLTDLEEHKLFFYTRIADRPAWPLISAGGPATDFGFKPFLQTDGSDLIRESVILGQGIALLPSWMMQEAERRKQVQRILPGYSTLPSPIYAVGPPSKEWTARQKAFIDFLRGELEKNEATQIRPS